MSLWTRIVSFITGADMRESLLPSGTGGIDQDEALYRPLTERGIGDLDAYTHDKMLGICLYLDRTNPVARRMLDLIRDFVFGEGLQVKANNQDVHEWLERHWDDPINNWDRRGPRLFRQLLRDGEVLNIASVNAVDGFVRWGSLPSRTVDAVMVDPNNWEIVQRIVRKRSGTEDQGKSWLAIRQSLETGRMEGEAMLWALNDDGQRGISFLYPLADMLDALEESVYNELERQQLLKAFLFDVTLQGANTSQIKEWVSDPTHGPPKPGSIRVHNENEQWNVLTPDLKAGDFRGGMEFHLNFVLGGAGIPLHWYGFGGDANRATAATMDEPIVKMLTYWQDLWTEQMEDLLRFVIDQAVIANSLSEMVEEQDGEGQPVTDGNGNVKMIRARDAFDIETPDMNTTDIVQVSTALQAVSNALSNAQAEHWVSEETAQRTFWLLLSHLGVDVNQAQEQRLLAQAQSDQGNQPQTTPQTQNALALAMMGQNGNTPQPNGTGNAPAG